MKMIQTKAIHPQWNFPFTRKRLRKAIKHRTSAVYFRKKYPQYNDFLNHAQLNKKLINFLSEINFF